MLALAFLWENLSELEFHKELTRKKEVLEECSWLKFNKLRQAPGIDLKFYTSVASEWKLKDRIFGKLVPTTVESLIVRLFYPTAILNRIKNHNRIKKTVARRSFVKPFFTKNYPIILPVLQLHSKSFTDTCKKVYFY